MTDKTFTVEEFVMKLIGPIEPVGDSSVDPKRLENLKELCKLTELLVARIDRIGNENLRREEWSMKEAGKFADNFLTNNLCIKE